MKKILAIDDCTTILKIISSVLKGKYDVITQENGMDAYNWLIKERNMPDLIISDIVNSPMNGYEFLELIRNSGFFGDIPVIILSGAEETKVRIKCYQLKAQDFLALPFNPKELIALVDKNLNPKIRHRNYTMKENERLYYYKLGALDSFQEPFDMKEAEDKIKEKIAAYNNFI